MQRARQAEANQFARRRSFGNRIFMRTKLREFRLEGDRRPSHFSAVIAKHIGAHRLKIHDQEHKSVC